MDMTKAISVSEKLDKQPNNGDGHIHTLKQREDSYQSAYEAGLASGKEAGYRRGYREGFSDGCKLCNPARRAAARPDTSTGASKKAAINGASRLRWVIIVTDSSMRVRTCVRCEKLEKNYWLGAKQRNDDLED